MSSPFPLSTFCQSLITVEGEPPKVYLIPLGGSAYFRESLRQSCSSANLDEADLKFLANHIAPGSSSGYGVAWRKFSNFCSSKGADPFTCSVAVIVKYIRFLFKEGAKYRTINHARSAISKLHSGIFSSCNFERYHTLNNPSLNQAKLIKFFVSY